MMPAFHARLAECGCLPDTIELFDLEYFADLMQSGMTLLVFRDQIRFIHPDLTKYFFQFAHD